MKVVIADPQKGKCYQLELDDTKSKPFNKEKIGSEVSGSLVGLNGYTLVITGGSDKQGFPMRKDVHGAERREVLLASGPGFKQKEKGERRKKTVCGNTIGDNTAQMNLKVTKYGEKPVAETLGIDESKPKEKKVEEEKPKAKKGKK